MPKFVQVATKSQIPESCVIGVQVEGKNLALTNLNGEIYALDNSRTRMRKHARFDASQKLAKPSDART
jgi:hypothetical protein